MGEVSHPGYIAVGPHQHGSGSNDRAKDRKLPQTTICSVDHLNPIRPWSDVEAAGLTEVEEHRPGLVQQGEYPQRSVRGDQVEIGHAAPEQRVSFAEVVTNVQTGHLRGQSSAQPVILTVDAAAMHATGHAFYQTANGVWLTDHVPPSDLSG